MRTTPEFWGRRRGGSPVASSSRLRLLIYYVAGKILLQSCASILETRASELVSRMEPGEATSRLIQLGGLSNLQAPFEDQAAATSGGRPIPALNRNYRHDHHSGNSANLLHADDDHYHRYEQSRISLLVGDSKLPGAATGEAQPKATEANTSNSSSESVTSAGNSSDSSAANGTSGDQMANRENNDNSSEDRTLMLIIISANLVILIIGFLGNLIVIVVIFRFTRIETVTDIYILNLAAADSMFILGLVFLTTTMIVGHWVFGYYMCKFYMTITSLCQFASSLLLVGMSFDRYLAVCHPIFAQRFRNPRNAKIICFCIWVACLILMIPIVTQTSGLQMAFSKTNEDLTCAIFWPEYSEFNCEVAFTLYSFTLGFATPLVLIAVFYLCVIRRLRKAASTQILGYSKRRLRSRETTNRRIEHLVIGIICTYTICWLPYWVTQLGVSFTKGGHSPFGSFYEIFLTSTCLSYTNSALNPILYAFLSDNFKRRCVDVLKSIRPFNSWPPNQQTGDTRGDGQEEGSDENEEDEDQSRSHCPNSNNKSSNGIDRKSHHQQPGNRSSSGSKRRRRQQQRGLSPLDGPSLTAGCETETTKAEVVASPRRAEPSLLSVVERLEQNRRRMLNRSRQSVYELDDDDDSDNHNNNNELEEDNDVDYVDLSPNGEATAMKTIGNSNCLLLRPTSYDLVVELPKTNDYSTCAGDARKMVTSLSNQKLSAAQPEAADQDQATAIDPVQQQGQVQPANHRSAGNRIKTTVDCSDNCVALKKIHKIHYQKSGDKSEDV